MQTVLDILRRAGGWHPGLSLSIEHPPHPDLVIEALDECGPCGLYALSATQYSNALAAPEMYFELSFAGGPNLNVFYYGNDHLGVREWSRFIAHGHYVFDCALHRRHVEFAALWDYDLRRQGFVDAFSATKQAHA